MKRSVLLVSALFAMGIARAQTPSTLQTVIVAPDKAVAVINQSLSGLWLSELRRPGPAASLPPIPAIVNFFAEGSFVASPGDGTQTITHGIWIRVGDRKFLGTAAFMGFNEARAFTAITKLRINYTLSADGKTLTGTSEATVMDRDGKVLNVLPGATFTMIRLSPEIPADFYDFQKLP
ncbi:MAG: hypothetical protein ABI972_22175 [Acidobacteriota bacterium]